MNQKITLSFDGEVIKKAKIFVMENKISLSRLVEFLLNKTSSQSYKSLEDIPVSDWVSQVAEGAVEYTTTRRSRKSSRGEFYNNHR